MDEIAGIHVHDAINKSGDEFTVDRLKLTGGSITRDRENNLKAKIL